MSVRVAEVERTRVGLSIVRTRKTTLKGRQKVVTIRRWYACISSRFFENQPNEICSHLSKKPSKGWFPISSKITPMKEKEGRKRKSEEEERRREKKQWLHSWYHSVYLLLAIFSSDFFMVNTLQHFQSFNIVGISSSLVEISRIGW